ncbi:MAG: serine protease, partial [Proteobacteria bacterium]|nr:serine protease [Pseudomonadota bacterium]
REGSGIVLDDAGLVLTIGYLMVEAETAEIRTSAGRTVPASVIGYDAETGFGLLRAIVPLEVRPMPVGRSAELKEGDAVLIASFGGAGMITPAQVVSKRPFAGNWEYLLEEAIFTSPLHVDFRSELTRGFHREETHLEVMVRGSCLGQDRGGLLLFPSS